MGCEVEGCTRPINRDGVCFPHKMKSIRFNGAHRLRQEREANTTQSEIAQEVFDDARTDGVDIQQVRGRRTATEVNREGKWEAA